ncbi:hypothetical protein MASR1M45_12650 [Candidatus Kapaibacterium sp.]
MINGFYRGNTFKLPVSFTFEDENSVVQSIPIDNATVYFTMKKKLTQQNYDIYKEITEHTNPSQGETEIILLPEETMVEPGVYFWDITVKFTDTDIHTFISGELTVKLGTTNVNTN